MIQSLKSRIVGHMFNTLLVLQRKDVENGTYTQIGRGRINIEVSKVEVDTLKLAINGVLRRRS
jgi:hypothetical protein